MKLISGSGAKPCENGGLLFNDLLQPQDILRQQKGSQRQNYRKSTGLSHLRGSQHTDKHLTLRLARSGCLQRLFPAEFAV